MRFHIFRLPCFALCARMCVLSIYLCGSQINYKRCDKPTEFVLSSEIIHMLLNFLVYITLPGAHHTIDDILLLRVSFLRLTQICISKSTIILQLTVRGAEKSKGDARIHCKEVQIIILSLINFRST